MYEKEKNKADVLYILEHLRLEDEHEAKVQKGDNFKEIILQEIMDNKSRTYLGCKKSDDTPVCIGGYTDTNEKGVGVVWLLSTPDIEKNTVCLFRHIIGAFGEIDNKYWLTYNILYRENKFAKKWLKKLGYKFDNPKPKELNIPRDFEFFYRIRPTRGLGEIPGSPMKELPVASPEWGRRMESRRLDGAVSQN